MNRQEKWSLAIMAVVVLLAAALWATQHELSKCQFKQFSPSYSPDRKYYTHWDSTLCRDHQKTRARLMAGWAGKQDQVMLLEMGSDAGEEVHLQWSDGPELHIQASKKAIRERYGPYED